MAKFTLLPQARTDMYEVWSYIARDNRPAADKWVAALNEVYATLARHPHLGQGIRYFLKGNYVIFYHIPIAVQELVSRALKFEPKQSLSLNSLPILELR